MYSSSFLLPFWLFSPSTAGYRLLTKQLEFFQFQSDVCAGRRIKVLELPPKFISGLLEECGSISKKRNMCVYMENHGYGPRTFNSSSGNSGGFEAWNSFYDTDQFSLELIFHNRISKYSCLTTNSSMVFAIYVPFYAGLEASRTLRLRNTAERDSVGKEVLRYISSLPGWKVFEGRDHFFVAGRIGKDFIWPINSSYWGNSLMTQPESKHIIMLTIEAASSQTFKSNNMLAIPYPTYFHPSSFNEICQWQRNVSRRHLKHLFAFAGAPRRGLSLRNELITQCKASGQQCGLISCGNGQDKECQSPLNVLKLFLDSKFCLQPPGDSPTRRSTFDSIISGCIPVFFSLMSGPEQYTWYFPKNYTEYSVYINQEDIRVKKVDIGKILSAIAESTVEAMRSKVVEMIPKVIYRNTSGMEEEEEEDAFDIALEGVLERVAQNKRAVCHGPFS